MIQKSESSLNYQNRFYVYAYLNPNKTARIELRDLGLCLLFEPIYIGKGTNGRIYDHLKEFNNKKEKSIFYSYIKTHKKYFKNKDFIIKIKDCLCETDAYNLEFKITSLFGLRINNTGCLFNMSLGGLGGKSRVVSIEEKLARSVNHPMKNKSYEEIYGVEKAKEIKLKRSKTLKNHPCYDINRKQQAAKNLKLLSGTIYAINIFSKEPKRMLKNEYRNNKNYTTFRKVLIKAVHKDKTLIFRDYEDCAMYFDCSISMIETLSKSGEIYSKNNITKLAGFKLRRIKLNDVLNEDLELYKKLNF